MLSIDLTNNTGLFIEYLIICLSDYYCTIYVFCKSKNAHFRIIQWVYTGVSGILLSLLFVFVRVYSAPLSHFLLFLFIPILISFLFRKRDELSKVLSIGFISYSFVVICELIATLIQTTILWSLGLVPYDLVAYISIVVLTFVLCVCVMRVKRFRKGFQFFQEEKNLGLGLLISSVVMVLRSIDLRDNQDTDYMYFYFVFGVIISGFGLYLWIRRSITAHYRERLQLKSEEHYKKVLEEREKEVEKLNQSNEYLAKIVHRDNHLMGALDASVDAYFSSTDETDKDTLLRELQTLAKERGELIAKEQLESKILPTTGNLLIDGAINDLYIKAAAHGIDFNLTVSVTVDEIIGKYISQTDLQTLLCDHIKDAIIAIDSRGEAGGKILVNLSIQNDNYSIDIYDNGVEFDIDTLSKLGLERVTTHADTGGSGIGFMMTFETLRKAYASLIITEFENKTPFTKSVSFRFDGESAFIIHSYRSEKLKECFIRIDVLFQDE